MSHINRIDLNERKLLTNDQEVMIEADIAQANEWSADCSKRCPLGILLHNYTILYVAYKEFKRLYLDR
jgi:hypothetical protein